MSENYNLVFLQKVHKGKDPAVVKANLAKAFNTEPEKVQAWFDNDGPFVILKDVTAETAERYRNAIIKCGAACDIRPGTQEDDGLSLIPKAFKTSDLFVCPSCGHEEDIPIGDKVEVCEACGLVLAKWEEKKREEEEKDKIRQRLLRNARLRDDAAEEEKRKREELARLMKLEAELRKELGIKGPSRFWVFFEQHPISVSTICANVLVGVTLLVNYILSDYLDRQAHAELVASEPTSDMQAMAPLMSASMQLSGNGQAQVLQKMAQMSQALHGSDPSQPEAVQQAATLMMKGADSVPFMNLASGASAPAPVAPVAPLESPDPADPKPVNVGIDPMTGMSEISGVAKFDDVHLASFTSVANSGGKDRIFSLLESQQDVTTDPDDPDAVALDVVDQLDGSQVSQLIRSLDEDKDWNQFMMKQVIALVDAGDLPAAEDLLSYLSDNAIRYRTLGKMMVRLYAQGDAIQAKVYVARAEMELDRVTDIHTKVKLMLEAGSDLAAAGNESEPANTLVAINDMIGESPTLRVKAMLLARLATFRLALGDKNRAQADLTRAVNTAGTIDSLVDRISAFTYIAQRYYDARENTLSQDLLTEATKLATTRLEVKQRAQIFAELAFARAYMGDLPGARIALSNTGKPRARQQARAAAADYLIAEERVFAARQVIDEMSNPTDRARRQARLISHLIDVGDTSQADTLLTSALRQINEITELTGRALVLGGFARLHVRMGNADAARALFKRALDEANLLSGRRSDIALATIAMDQGYSLMISDGQQTLLDIKNVAISEPVQTRLDNVDRIGKKFNFPTVAVR